MTALFGQRHPDPAWCGCCGRRSDTVGVVETPDCFSNPMLWVCEACKARSGFKVIDMNVMKLDAIETKAISHAASQVAADIFETALKILWEGGVRDLGKLDHAALSAGIASLKADPAINGIAAKLLVNYSNELRRLVAGEK